MFISAGGKFKEEHQVTDIVPGEMVTVKTNKGSFSTKRLVITAGPWTNTLLQSISLKLPLKVSNKVKVKRISRYILCNDVYYVHEGLIIKSLALNVA